MDEELELSPAFGRLSTGVSNEALAERAKARRKEKYGVAGKAIGGLAGGIGAILTGNPQLLSMGMQAGESVGELAGGGLKDTGKSRMSGAEASKLFEQAKKIKGQYDSENPDWGSMDADQITKLLGEKPELKENYFSFLDSLTSDGGSLDDLASQGLQILSSPQGAGMVGGM